MDMIKIGKFLSELRREKNLTQEELGEELGVTNKTVSRWETGTYLPPVEIIQILSQKYGVSINEILSGERISDNEYKEKAEENMKEVLSKSVFTLKDKDYFFTRKWNKEHRFELVLEILAIIAAFILTLIFFRDFGFVICILAFVWSASVNNRRRAYVEKHLFDDKNIQNTDEDKK